MSARGAKSSLAAFCLPLLVGAAGCACGSSDDGAGGAAPATGSGGTTAGGTSSSGATSSTSSVHVGGDGNGNGGAPVDSLGPCDHVPASSAPVPDGYPAGAKRIQGLPAEVEVFELPAPSEALSWISCGSGCVELETPWAEAGKGALISTSRGGLDGDQPWLALQERSTSGVVITRVGPVQEEAASALVEREVTGLVDVGFSVPRVVGGPVGIFMVFYRDQVSFAYGVPNDGPPVCLAKGPGLWLPMTAAYADGRWATSGSMQPVVTGLWPPGSQVAQRTAPNGDQLDDVAALGEGFACGGYGWDELYRLWAWQPGEPMAELVIALDPSQEDLCCPTADEGTVAWFRGLERYEAGGRHWNRVELFTHPLPITSFPVTGTLVRQVPQDGLGHPGTIHGDYFAHFGHVGDGAQYAYVVRLSDGLLWKIPPRTADKRWLKVMYLSDSEVALLEGHFGELASWADTVVRYDLSSLGPGEPPP